MAQLTVIKYKWDFNSCNRIYIYVYIHVITSKIQVLYIRALTCYNCFRQCHVLLAPRENVLVLDVGSIQFTSQQSFHPEGGLASLMSMRPEMARSDPENKLSKNIQKDNKKQNHDRFVRSLRWLRSWSCLLHHPRHSETLEVDISGRLATSMVRHLVPSQGRADMGRQFLI